LSLTGNIGSILRWEYSGTNTVGSYSAIASSAASLTVGALYQDLWVRVVVKSGACAEATSNAIKITLQWPIANNYIGNSQTICSGNTPAALEDILQLVEMVVILINGKGELQEAGQIFQALRALAMLLVQSQKIQNSEE
jgi:hypothetical protein